MKPIDTKCVQAGYAPKNGEPRILPIYQSTTFAYDTPEEMGDLFDLKASGYFYTRLGNPTLGYAEEKLTALEGGSAAVACSSGMASTTLAVLTVAEAGDNIVSLSTIYGGTYNLFAVTLPKLGIGCKFVSPDCTAAELAGAIDERTKLVFAETLANPAMNVTDFEILAEVCKGKGVLFMVDNTLATPYICRPFEFGANVIVHSSTKYLDGHATSVGGFIVDGGNFAYAGNPRYAGFNEPDESYHGVTYAKDCGNVCFAVKARVQYMRDIGAQMAPFNAFLTNLGMETLHLRMERHSQNALAVAKMLKNHPAVEWVKYAGLESDPNYKKANKYFYKGLCSGMVTFGIKGGTEAASKFQKALKLLKIVTHIADVRSCVLHPATTTHRQLGEKDLLACGIAPNLVRLSIGIENGEDIIADIKNALDNCGCN